MNDAVDYHAESRARLIFWVVAIGWGVAAWFIAQQLSAGMRFRVNDLAAIPGAGVTQRDAEGVYYHVNAAGKARAIFRPAADDDGKPTMDPPVYDYDCLDCTQVTGEQMSQTNEFCASGKLSELPTVRFEIPCKTWAPIGEGRKVVAFIVFIAPIMLWWMLRAVVNRLRRRTPAKPAV